MRKELLPENGADELLPWTPNRRIPPALRAFGKFIDTTNLNPGDLILTREINPDHWISKVIPDVQVQLGYDENDARWTHVALYVGDGLRLIEATFDGVIAGGEVKLTYLYDYCGNHAVRFRRPQEVPRDPNGWKLAIEAAVALGEKYNFLAAIKMFMEAYKTQSKHWDANTREYVKPGIVCSTLYADCFAKVTRKSLADSGVCVPAYLSCCEEFSDIDVRCRPIGPTKRLIFN